ncbi:MAG: hypothetical protein M1838_005728 [Thelocarpon superellum]|nr:MAG: hypothetical protein M1838_005728 [Thelocarpon superellum]
MHIITNGVVPYETPFREFQFRITMVPCGISVNELVRSLNLGDGPYQQVGVSECIELGDGAWGKGVTVFKGTEAGSVRAGSRVDGGFVELTNGG